MIRSGLTLNVSAFMPISQFQLRACPHRCRHVESKDCDVPGGSADVTASWCHVAEYLPLVVEVLHYSILRHWLYIEKQRQMFGFFAFLPLLATYSPNGTQQHTWRSLSRFCCCSRWFSHPGPPLPPTCSYHGIGRHNPKWRQCILSHDWHSALPEAVFHDGICASWGSLFLRLLPQHPQSFLGYICPTQPV